MHTKTPAAQAIEAFGGPSKLAKVAGRSISRIYRWTYPVDRGGTGGAIPGGSKMIARILAAAQDQDIALSLEQLIFPTEPVCDARKPRDIKRKA